MQRIAFGVVLGIALPVLAGPWPVQQLTDNTTYDASPSVSGGIVVWRGWGGSSKDIFRYDGATTRATDTAVTEESNPCIAGNVLVWEDDLHIYLQDGSGMRQIGSANSPYHGRPQTDGKSIVWSGGDGGADREIFLYDIATETTTQLTVNGDEDRYPRIDGGRVVWEQIAHNNTTGIVQRVMLYDGKEVRQITPEHADWFRQMPREPDISGNRVVYGERIPTYDEQGTPLQVDQVIMVYDILADTTLSLGVPGEWAQCARISGDLVVWGSYTTNQPDLWGVHLLDGELMRITDNDYAENQVEVDGHTIVWQGHDGIDYEIFSAVMPEPTTLLLLLPILYLRKRL